ncbi:MAG: hypothetical protein ACRD2L_00645 [Terriglobia bacterium]
MLDELRVSDKLDEKEKAILEELGKMGAAVPAELAAKTLLLPEEIYPHLVSLREKGLIETREASSSLPGELISLSASGLRFVKFSRMTNQTR